MGSTLGQNGGVAVNASTLSGENLALPVSQAAGLESTSVGSGGPFSSVVTLLRNDGFIVTNYHVVRIETFQQSQASDEMADTSIAGVLNSRSKCNAHYKGCCGGNALWSADFVAGGSQWPEIADYAVTEEV
ncbi:hypothetical protein [Magnetospirillum moscoviense]|uniref:hypothetical protein n=1 Tax=Magnetospirillum moscoviense TaxID=1437059 RepID=UPI0012E83091|nr:hypothetical protein [Magnetospirillum moscoviense]MBF0327142.1 hypothetical protein [Alphaproteobacteria bacterium]